MGVDLRSLQIPFLRDEEIRRRADVFRDKYWGDKVPVDVELIAERNLKLLMIPVPELRSQVQTDAFLSNDLKEIMYDPKCPDVRVRFSVAHEVAHLLLHADVIGAFRPQSSDEWKEMQRQLPETLWGRAEYQAREFAGRLLVPLHKLIEVLRELQPLIVKAKQRISEENPFKKKGISLDGFILTTTEKSKIPGAEELDWETLRRDYRIIRQEGTYPASLLRH